MMPDGPWDGQDHASPVDLCQSLGGTGPGGLVVLNTVQARRDAA